MYLAQPVKISIVLPFYNAQATLIRALESIRNQSCRYFECILVDNNSTDLSLKIARDFKQKDKRFRVFAEKKQGVVFASNTGTSLASGKYICRMDADDWMFPERLEIQADFLDKNMDYDVVTGLAEYGNEQFSTEGFRRYVNWVNSVRTYKEIFLKRFIESPVVNPTAMWRKKVSDNLGMYSWGDFPEDYELWLRWLEAGVKIHKIDQPVLRWYDSSTRLTRTDQRYSEKAFYNIKTKYLLHWLKQHNPHHPKVVIWGASRISRKRVRIIENDGIRISHYIDISLKRKLDKDVILFSEIPAAGKAFILVYIAQTEARYKIKTYLDQIGYNEGQNYLFVS
jgi:glycosyltransferase involved in cell wall biosynthesis